jgi:hypothetical protein
MPCRIVDLDEIGVELIEDERHASPLGEVGMTEFLRRRTMYREENPMKTDTLTTLCYHCGTVRIPWDDYPSIVPPCPTCTAAGHREAMDCPVCYPAGYEESL